MMMSKKYDLKPKERMASPMDSIARKNNYISTDSIGLLLKLRLVLGDQTAIAPGYL
jgi:hypothetical protein